MKVVTLDCNQKGRKFEGVQVKANPQPLRVTLVTPKGEFLIDIPADVVIAGILPALRNFVLTNAKKIGVSVTSDGTGRQSGRIQMANPPADSEESNLEESNPEQLNPEQPNPQRPSKKK